MNLQTIIQELFEEAQKHALSWARSCAATVLTDVDQTRLEKHASALMMRFQGRAFEILHKPGDKTRAEISRQLARDLEDAEMASARADADVTLRAQDVADHVLPEEPRANTKITAFCAALLAAGVAVGLYDGVRDRTNDAALAWVIAFAVGIACGLFITHSLYNPTSPKSRKEGILGGLALSVTTGLLRIALSEGGWFIAISLTALELSIVWILDWQGKALRDAFEAWEAERVEHERRQQRYDAAQEVARRAADRVRVLREEKVAHGQTWRYGSMCFHDLEEIEQALKEVEVTAAWRGIAENRGLKRGVIPEYMRLKG